VVGDFVEKYKDMKIKKKANIKLIRNLVFFLLLIIFTFWFIFKDQDLNELLKALKQSNIIYIIISAFLMFLVYFMESINVRSILISLGEKKFSILKALKYTSIGAFFSAITPAATGGQPVEIYYMSKDGIKSYNGTMAMLIQLCGFQISTLSFSIICAILNPNLLKDGIIWFYLLGLTINGFALIMMLLGIFSSKVTNRILNFVLKIIKISKIKNYDLIKKKIEEGLMEYSKSSAYIKENKSEFIKAIIRVFIQIFIYHSIPYFIYKSFGLNELSFFNFFTMQAVLYTTVSGIPLPGAIGVSEMLFLKLYGAAFGSVLLSGAMLLYRFVSFYLYVIIFLFVVIINGIKSKNIESDIDKNIKEIDEIRSSSKLSYS